MMQSTKQQLRNLNNDVRMKLIPRQTRNVLKKSKEVVAVNTSNQVETKVYTTPYERELSDKQTYVKLPSYASKKPDVDNIVFNTFATCQLCSVFKDNVGNRDDVLFMGTGTVLAPGFIVTTYHLYEFDDPDYVYTDTLYTFERNTDIEWSKPDMNRLTIFGGSEMRREVNQLKSDLSHVIGGPYFDWKTLNDVVLLIDQNGFEYASILIPQTIDIQKRR
jgi:hypothetical protein